MRLQSCGRFTQEGWMQLRVGVALLGLVGCASDPMSPGEVQNLHWSDATRICTAEGAPDPSACAQRRYQALMADSPGRALPRSVVADTEEALTRCRQAGFAPSSPGLQQCAVDRSWASFNRREAIRDAAIGVAAGLSAGAQAYGAAMAPPQPVRLQTTCTRIAQTVFCN